MHVQKPGYGTLKDPQGCFAPEYFWSWILIPNRAVGEILQGKASHGTQAVPFHRENKKRRRGNGC